MKWWHSMDSTCVFLCYESRLLPRLWVHISISVPVRTFVPCLSVVVWIIKQLRLYHQKNQSEKVSFRVFMDCFLCPSSTLLWSIHVLCSASAKKSINSGPVATSVLSWCVWNSLQQMGGFLVQIPFKLVHRKEFLYGGNCMDHFEL